jgi:hypothetical protein
MMASGFFVRHDCTARGDIGGKSMGLQEVNGKKAAACVPPKGVVPP